MHKNNGVSMLIKFSSFLNQLFELFLVAVEAVVDCVVLVVVVDVVVVVVVEYGVSVIGVLHKFVKQHFICHSSVGGKLNKSNGVFQLFSSGEQASVTKA